jgi:hypothetical protein
VSPDVHALPSSQAAVFGVFWQCPPTQASSVQGFVSTHSPAEVQEATTGLRSALKL